MSVERTHIIYTSFLDAISAKAWSLDPPVTLELKRRLTTFCRVAADALPGLLQFKTALAPLKSLQ